MVEEQKRFWRSSRHDRLHRSRIAWFAESESLARAHAIAAKALIALLVLHVAGALANHYWFRTDVLVRMLPGHGRDVSDPPASFEPRR